MTAFLDLPQTKYLGAAIFMLGVAWGIIKWIGRTLRSQLGTGMPRTPYELPVTHMENVPPILVKQAIERGLVSPSQLAAMAPMEREFFFVALRESALHASPTSATAAPSSLAPPVSQRAS